MMLLTACVAVPDDPPNPTAETGPAPSCCSRTERYPAALVHLVELGAPVIVPIVGSIEFRKGWLESHPVAEAYIAERLRPLDIVAVVAGGRASLVPGLFDHVALYIGDEADMRALGLWDHPALRPWRDRLRSEPILVEAHRSGVRVQRLDQVIDVDSVAVLRPALRKAERREAVVRALDLVGTPFDFRFDVSTPECLFCTEMVMRAIPQLRVPARRAYGRPTVLPDEMARMALLHGSGLSLASYVTATRMDWRAASPGDLEQALETAWRPKKAPSH